MAFTNERGADYLCDVCEGRMTIDGAECEACLGTGRELSDEDKEAITTQNVMEAEGFKPEGVEIEGVRYKLTITRFEDGEVVDDSDPVTEQEAHELAQIKCPKCYDQGRLVDYDTNDHDYCDCQAGQAAMIEDDVNEKFEQIEGFRELAGILANHKKEANVEIDNMVQSYQRTLSIGVCEGIMQMAALLWGEQDANVLEQAAGLIIEAESNN